jgi:hypothetical protein
MGEILPNLIEDGHQPITQEVIEGTTYIGFAQKFTKDGEVAETSPIIRLPKNVISTS